MWWESMQKDLIFKLTTPHEPTTHDPPQGKNLAFNLLAFLLQAFTNIEQKEPECHYNQWPLLCYQQQEEEAARRSQFGKFIIIVLYEHKTQITKIKFNTNFMR